MPVAIEAKRSIDELRELYEDLHQLGLNLRESALRFQDLVRTGSFAERGRTFAYSPEDPKDILNRSIDITKEFEFLVAVTGAFSSGKSTLINLILDQPELLPASVIPLTAVCTVVRYSQQPAIRVRYVPYQECFERVRMCIDHPFKKPFTGPEHVLEALESPASFLDEAGACEMLQRFAGILRRYDEITAIPITFEERAPYIAGGGLVRKPDGTFRYFRPTPTEEREYLSGEGATGRWVTREWLALVRDVTLWVPSPLLENDIVFLDLPGLNCREDYHRRAIQEYCNMADCILVTAFQPGNQADEQVISNFKKLSANYHEKIFFAFNKVDQFAQEPRELVRAVDYLARDTIGEDFPADRFFLTSGQLARAHRFHEEGSRQDLQRLANALAEISSTLPGLDGWIRHAVDEKDPGGIGHLKRQLYAFLVNDAYPTKLTEVLRNFRCLLDSMKNAASPTFEESQHLDAKDLLRKSVLEYFRHAEKLQRTAIYRFRFDYLRGNDAQGASVLREDLKVILEETHLRVEKAILGYFDRPILSAPLRDDPVSEFDLLIIADEASRKLRRELQDLITQAVHERIRGVFDDHLRQCDFKQHIHNLFRGAPECARRLDGILARFEDTMLHSLKCIVRNGFFSMPRGRELKRLERNVSLASMKDLLVEVFEDFYPSWIYEHIYGQILDHLWLSLFLDSEDLEEELGEFFRGSEGVITGIQVGEQVEVPQKLMDGTRDTYRLVRMCKAIEDLQRETLDLQQRSQRLGVGV